MKREQNARVVGVKGEWMVEVILAGIAVLAALVVAYVVATFE